MTMIPSELFDRIYSRHGHRCPMSTLGGRMGWAAREALGEAEGTLEAVYFASTCALDGIRETTGCHETSGTLRMEDRGEHRLRLTGPASVVEATLRPFALRIAERYRICCARLEAERSRLGPEQIALREAERERVLQSVLQELWTLPDRDLIDLWPLEETHYA